MVTVAQPAAAPALPLELGELYPFRSRYLALPGGRMHYLDEGPREGLPVLMLHGNPTWSFYYRELVRGLSDRYRVIVPDHLGCGLSDKPQGFGYRLADHIANVRLLIERLGLARLALVVHDWGGAIGMGVAVEQPELFRRLVVFNTAAFLAPRMPALLKVARLPGLGAAMIRGLNAFARGALATCVVHRERLTPAVRRGYLLPYDSWANRVATLRFVQDIPMDPRHPSHPVLAGIEARLPRLAGVPMQIIWGRHDFVFDDHFLGEWRRRFPAARVEVVEDAGHYVVEDAYERIVPWLARFLAEDGGRA